MAESAKPACHQVVIGFVLAIAAMSGFVAPAGKPEEGSGQTGAHFERVAPGLAFQAKRAIAQEDPVSLRPAQAVRPSEAQLPTSEGPSEAIAPPVNVERAIDSLRARVRNAEMAILSGDASIALELIGEVENRLASLQREHGGDIPAGHGGLLVLEERLVYLKREARELQEAGD